MGPVPVLSAKKPGPGLPPSHTERWQGSREGRRDACLHGKPGHWLCRPAYSGVPTHSGEPVPIESLWSPPVEGLKTLGRRSQVQVLAPP